MKPMALDENILTITEDMLINEIRPRPKINRPTEKIGSLGMGGSLC